MASHDALVQHPEHLLTPPEADALALFRPRYLVLQRVNTRQALVPLGVDQQEAEDVLVEGREGHHFLVRRRGERKVAGV